MDVSDILKINWVRDEEFPEKWYDTEICLNVIAKNNNPLAAIFTRHGLNVLVVNDILYSEDGADFYCWDEDRKAATRNSIILHELIQEQERYIKKAEEFANTVNKLKVINESHLEKFKEILISLWCVFLSDLGKPFAFEVEERLNSKRIKGNQKEKIKDYLAGLKTKLPSKIKKIINYKDIKYLESVRKCIYIDNYAAEIYSKLEGILTNSLNKKLNINSEELTMYSFTDLEKLIKHKIKLSAKDIEERKNFRIMAQINGKITMFYGKKNFEKIESVLQNNIKANTNNFSGIVASRGIAKGLVRIVKTIKDMDKVKKGDILVASTTRPDLMPALLRCSAIVTDTGGITSHAAIISRELKIPCIVGTNIATQTLKTGDLVEVDANKGVVKILK